MNDYQDQPAHDQDPADQSRPEPRGADVRKQASPAFKDSVAQETPTFAIIGEPGPLFAALAAAQGAFSPINKNRTVTVRPRDKAAYTFDYATLDQVLAATVPALSANGLALIQPFYHGPNGLELRTILAHSSGARLEAVTELPKVDSIQGAGSALTYLKRYQVQAVLGVSSEEDDDGNAADGNKVENSQPRDRSRPPAPPQRPAPKPAPAKPAAAAPEPAAPAPSEPSPVVDAELSRIATQGILEPLTKETGTKLGVLFRRLEYNGQQSKEFVAEVCGVAVADAGKITEPQGRQVVAALEAEAAAFNQQGANGS